MAPIKFEENIKEKLEKRTIKPSGQAWDKLSNRLDTKNEKKDSKAFWWTGIAASVIAVLFTIVTKFYNKGLNDEISSPKVVIEPSVIINKEQEAHFELVKPIEKEEVLQLQKESNKELELVLDHVDIVKHPVITKTEALDRIENEDLTKPIKIEELSFEDKKIQEVVVQVNFLQDSNKIVSDETIEALLRKAQNEINMERIQNINTDLVDANLLLQSVEYELDESFRNKVFKALKDNLNKVKTAVAQRNE